MTKYWNEEQEEAVCKYVFSGTTQSEKDVLYRQYLKGPLKTMTESIIRRYNLYVSNVHYDVLFFDTVSFVLMQVNKFNPEKVSEKTGKKVKAYSYIQTIIKHRLIAEREKQYKNSTRYTLNGDMFTAFQDSPNVAYEMDVNGQSSNQVLIEETIKDIQKKIDENNEIKGTKTKLLLNENEEKVGLALVELFNNWEDIIKASNNKLNKNVTLEFIRDYTFLETKHIRKAMVKYKSSYFSLKKLMIENDQY